MNAEDKKILLQVLELRASLEKAYFFGIDTETETDATEKFFESSFEIAFNDKISGERKSINLPMAMGYYNLMSNLFAEIERIAKL